MLVLPFYIMGQGKIDTVWQIMHYRLAAVFYSIKIFNILSKITKMIMDIVELGEEEIKDIIKANLQAVK